MRLRGSLPAAMSPARELERIDLEYVLPLRWDAETSARESDGLCDYLVWLSTIVDVTVVDGSGLGVFRRHQSLWGRSVRHLRPDSEPGLNGKVAGVITGVSRSRHE